MSEIKTFRIKGTDFTFRGQAGQSFAWSEETVNANAKISIHRSLVEEVIPVPEGTIGILVTYTDGSCTFFKRIDGDKFSNNTYAPGYRAQHIFNIHVGAQVTFVGAVE